MKDRLLGVLLAGALAFPTYAQEAGKPVVVSVKKAALEAHREDDVWQRRTERLRPAAPCVRTHWRP